MDPPETVTAEAAATTQASAAPAAGGESFLPALPSVWNTTIGPDNMTGECTKGSVLPVYGLVQVTPADASLATIEWKNQEPKPYTFKQVQPNQFSYAGPTSINDGVVTMTVTFESATAFKMVREFVSVADPGCLHTHDYTGEFKWTR